MTRMARMTIICFTRPSARIRRNILDLMGNRVVEETTENGRYVVEIEDGTQHIWAHRYAELPIVKTVLYSRPRTIDVH
jgi:hypothetical protein